MTNYAETLVKEANDDTMIAEDFKNWLYPNTQENQYNDAGRVSPERSSNNLLLYPACPQYSRRQGEKAISKKSSLLHNHYLQLPETSFKFNYQRNKSDLFKELGIEVVK
ncbi:MAG: hypothetical protein ACOCT9_00080 [archaeon]